jgi:peptidyl-prolyl cis-trans isomerase SurA
MRFLILVILGLTFTYSALAQPNRVPLDGIVAQIGDNVILTSDIEAQVLQAKQAEVKDSPELRCNILEGIMYQQLLTNQAMLDSLVVTDQQVDAEMENRIRVIEEQIGGRDKMEKFYGKTISQIKAEFREIIRERMLAQEMERQITQNLTITPREVKEFYDGLPLDSVPFINQQMTYQQIVMFPEITKHDKERAKEELTSILSQARSGKNFASLARMNSDDTGSASQGGVIEARRGMMVAPFEATVFSLKEGEVSDVFESEYGYHIVKLIERKGDNYKCAHILKIPTYTEKALEAAALKMDTCYRQLKANEITWDEAVLKYSNDENTRLNRGIISNPYTGDQKWDAAQLSEIDNQIYVLTDRLKVGDITEPNLYVDMMSRKEGVRILRLSQRTEPHRANLKQDYPLIQAAAENVKKQKMVDEWAQKKIKLAYIKINEAYEGCAFKHQWIVK